MPSSAAQQPKPPDARAQGMRARLPAALLAIITVLAVAGILFGLTSIQDATADANRPALAAPVESTSTAAVTGASNTAQQSGSGSASSSPAGRSSAQDSSSGPTASNSAGSVT